MNFHETRMGHIFFEHQLPQLIQSIQALTAALGKPPQAVLLPVEADPNFLSELHFGNYESDVFKSNPEWRKLILELNDAYDTLIETLSGENCGMLDRYLEIAGDRNMMEAKLAYESGFRTAVQMIMAGMSRPVFRQGEDKE